MVSSACVRTQWGTRAGAWLAMAIALCAMSSGGVWFALLADTPPILKACWRLALTSIFQVPLFIRQLRRSDTCVYGRWRASMPIMCATGATLAVHFATWAWSINHTSLAHSLLFVSTTPLLIVAFMLVRYGASRVLLRRAAHTDFNAPGTPEGAHAHSTVSNDTDALVADDGATLAVDMSPVHSPGAAPQAQEPAGSPPQSTEQRNCNSRVNAWLGQSQLPTALEVAGTLVGFAAAAVLADAAARSASVSSTTTRDRAPTLAGDLVATLGAAAMGVYLAVGGSLRAWMPAFMFALPVTASAAVSAAIASLMFEADVGIVSSGPRALFGWISSDRNLLLPTLAAAGFSGILGHTLAIVSLEHISALIVSVVLLLEPLVGSVFGWAAGVQGMPDAATLAAGPFLMLGAALVTLGERGSPFHAAVGRACVDCKRRVRAWR